MPGLLVSGNIVFDILVRPVETIPWNATEWVDSIAQSLGGNGANTSYAAARLGASVRLIGAVGRDAFAGIALDRLQSVGVDTSLVARLEEPTATTVALVRDDGARAFLHRPGASGAVFREPIEFTPALTDGSTHYHAANPFALPLFRAAAGESVRRARAAGLQTSLDTGWDSRGEWMGVIGPCLPHLDLLFVNEDEARLLTGHADAGAAARAFRERGVHTVAVKLGARGCLLATAGGERRYPAFRVETVDSTGAGDCFAGGFLAALLRGGSLEEAARLANAAGALSVSSLGATDGLRSYEETVAWASEAALLP